MQIWDEPLCSFWSAVVFLGTLAWMPFLQSLCWIVNLTFLHSWARSGLQFFRYCSGLFCDFLDVPSMHFMGSSPLFQLYPFVEHHGSEFQSRRNDFLTLTRLIDVNDFVTSLCHKGSVEIISSFIGCSSNQAWVWLVKLNIAFQKMCVWLV